MVSAAEIRSMVRIRYREHLALGRGNDAVLFDPPQNADYAPYTSVTLRRIAAGIGVAVEDLTGDYQNMPFSAARAATGIRSRPVEPVEPTLRERLKAYEGFRERPYRDTKGKLTVGWGHLLERPYTAAECERLLSADIGRASSDAASLPTTGARLDAVRHDVLAEMCFQLGRRGVLRFERMLAAVRASDWETAAAEILDSQVAREQPRRWGSLADRMRTGRLSGGA